MGHFIEGYSDRLNDLLHFNLAPNWFYKQEILEVPELLTAILVTYDGVTDDQREIHANSSWETFLERMAKVKPDWIHFDRSLIERLRDNPGKTLGGWEGRTIYFIRGGQNAEQWTTEKAETDVGIALASAATTLGPLLQHELEHLKESLPAGPEHFREFEHQVRVAFNFLFRGDLGEGRAQSRTEPEDEGLEIRYLVFGNVASSGFWKDLKSKYEASEIVVDAKNKELLTRDDLRQLYCYLKPALGLWGFIVTRSEQPKWVHAFNRTLFKNFTQSRGLLILCVDDLRRMVTIKNLGRNPSAYLQEKMSEFLRSI
jgi:hypothetical protein